MEKFTRIFTTVGRKQSGMSIAEVGIATAITLSASAFAYNQISDNRNSKSSPSFRELSANIHGHVNTILGKLLKPVDGQITSCVTNNDIHALSNGTYNTSTGSIVRYTESGDFSRNTVKMGKAYCSGSGMSCFVRRHYQNVIDETGNRVKKLQAETLFGAQAVAVTIERNIVMNCVNSSLASSNHAPGLKYFMQTTEVGGFGQAMSKKVEDLIVGNLPSNAAILSAIYSGGGSQGESLGVTPRHYWVPWMYRYVNFDKLPPLGQGLLYGFKQGTSSRRSGRRSRTTIYGQLYYTYGCTEAQLHAADPNCRCYVRTPNQALATQNGWVEPQHCIKDNPYGNEYNPGAFLAPYKK